jgi:anti-anti-sigma factor
MDRQALAFQARQDGAEVSLSVAGEIDMSTADSLFQQVSTLVKDTTRALVLDLGGVTFCDSLGVAALVRIYKHSQAAGYHLRLTNLREHVRHVLHISGLDQVLVVGPA